MKLRILILGVQWHGDVAPFLANAFQRRHCNIAVHYIVDQRRKGVYRRLSDELIHLPHVGTSTRALQLSRAAQGVTDAVLRYSPDATVCLTPELLCEEAVESVLSACPAVWWFGDDPSDPSRHSLQGGPAVLQYLAESRSVTLAANPLWGEQLGAATKYLPYASVYEPVNRGVKEVDRRGVVVVASSRARRAEILAKLAPSLRSELQVWGWGARARIGIATRNVAHFRGNLRGVRPLNRQEVKKRFLQASVVLNLQDEQMYGSWNPQTFDVMALAMPQVVVNRNPIALFEYPPIHAFEIEDILNAIEAARSLNCESYWIQGAAEIASHHRWINRVDEILLALSARP